MGQVWYLIVSIPDLCTLTYLEVDTDSNESEDESEHPFFVGVIYKVHSVNSDEDKSLYYLLKIEDKTVKFKLGTGLVLKQMSYRIAYPISYQHGS